MTEQTDSITDRASAALDQLVEELAGEFNEEGYWTGELSSSALSTAVATIALGELDRQLSTNQYVSEVKCGLHWLADNINADGGWGDTIRSKSNISTTALCWAAFGAAGSDGSFRTVVQRAEAWLIRAAGSLEDLPHAIAERYGRDRTFSVPILMTCALAGRLGPNGWRKVPGLPFELAMFPRSWFGALKLPVVSYALPALIAIGQVIHHHAPSRNPIARLVRAASRSGTLNLLTNLQPDNGGFLEATPLTAFVTMSLASAGHAKHVVAQKGGSFLRKSIREDGSWPIDTNLSTWVTTLSVKALMGAPKREPVRRWLLKQQFKTEHQYTGAAPGGWAWTDLPGGVPDADDTAGALIALSYLGERTAEAIQAAEQGIEWLLNLQNSDGGIPTFCRGWGTLPFDRSSPELTAHALRAFESWRSDVSAALQARIEAARRRGIAYLVKSQRADGAFISLWFGNERGYDDQNPVYGTAQVLIGLAQGWLRDQLGDLRERAAEFLINAQHANGGWGGDENLPETVEETALALDALCACHVRYHESERRALARLVEMIEQRHQQDPSPIGFYFARLWYYERLYPVIFSVSALRNILTQRKIPRPKEESNRPASPA